MKNAIDGRLCACVLIVVFLALPLFCYAQDAYVEQKIIPSDISTSRGFGSSVSICKKKMVVGNLGLVYIFERKKTHWAEVAKIEPNDGIFHFQFGRSVSIANQYVLIGDWEDPGKGEGTGAAYIFKQNGDSWIQMAKLTASDGAVLDRFGEPVSTTDRYAIIGAHGTNNADGSFGAAYIFQHNGKTWIETAKLTAGGTSKFVRFGTSVAITNRYAIVGGLTESATIFKRTGKRWIEMAKLTGSDTTPGDHFGSLGVAITNQYAIIGAQADEDFGTQSGSAYIFKRSGNTWTQTAKLTASDATAFDGFGSSVSLTDSTAVIGAFFPETGDGSGAAYIFKRDGETWRQAVKLTASDTTAWDSFGTSVALSNKYAIVGASGARPGAVYSYSIDQGQPIGCDDFSVTDDE